MNPSKMNLVFFKELRADVSTWCCHNLRHIANETAQDAQEHLARAARIIRQPRGGHGVQCLQWQWESLALLVAVITLKSLHRRSKPFLVSQVLRVHDETQNMRQSYAEEELQSSN